MMTEFLPSIDPKTVAEIRDNLKEDPDRVRNNVRLLEEWISYQKYLPQNYDRKMLLSFLRGCKQDLEKAKRKIETYFIAHSTQFDLFGDISLTMDGDLSSSKYLASAILPELTPEGYRITIFQVTDSDASDFQVERVLRYANMLADLRIYNDIHQVAGEILIVDTNLISTQHVTKFLCNLTRKSVELIQNAYPLKLKQIHVITKLNMAVKAVGVIKQFFKEKLRNRFHVHPRHDLLSNYIPLKCLPSDYDGSLKSIKEFSDELCEFVKSTDLFDELAKQKITGPIPKNNTLSFSNEDFGVDGSFRKLNLD